MATDTDRKRHRVTGVVKGASLKEGKHGNYLEVQCLRDRMQHPDTYRCFDEHGLSELKYLIEQPGTRHTLVLEESGNLNSRGRPYLNLIGEAELEEHPPSSSGGAPASGNGGGSVDSRIAWNSAVNNAVHYLAGCQGNAFSPEELQAAILDYAPVIYQVIVAGSPQGEVEDTAQPEADRTITKEEYQHLNQAVKQAQIPAARVMEWLQQTYGKQPRELTPAECQATIEAVRTGRLDQQEDGNDDFIF